LFPQPHPCALLSRLLNHRFHFGDLLW
jgi:hypothetical protein